MNDFRHYIYAGGTKVAIVSRPSTGGSTTHYIREDLQGSIAGIENDGSDPSNLSFVKESFTAFGLRRNCCTGSGPPTSGMLARINSVTRQGYTGQTALGNMGLNDMNGRVQDAVTGRFLSADPYIPDPGATQSYNRYSYVANNPLTFVDPSGFVGCVTVEGVGRTDCDPIDPFPSAGGAISAWVGDGPSVPTTTDLLNALIGMSLDNLIAEQKDKDKDEKKPQEGHDYRTHNLVCHRPLTNQEQRDLISRFTVPNSYTLGQPKGPGTYMVATWGIPGGWVNTTFTPDGLTGQNVTTPFHVFTGIVQRTITNTSSGAEILTHGTGGYSFLPPPSPYASMETSGARVDIGGLLDLLNDATGPGIFNNVDQAAAAYAQANFPGC